MKPGYILGVVAACVLAVAALTSREPHSKAGFAALLLVAAALAAWGAHDAPDRGTSTAVTRDAPPPASMAPVALPSLPPHRAQLSMHETLQAPLASADREPITEHAGDELREFTMQRNLGAVPVRQPMAHGALRKRRTPTTPQLATMQDVRDMKTAMFKDFVAAHQTQLPEDYAAFMASEAREARVAGSHKSASPYEERTQLTPDQLAAYRQHLPSL